MALALAGQRKRWTLARQDGRCEAQRWAQLHAVPNMVLFVRLGLTGDIAMSKTRIRDRARELLTLARKLAETPGLTWVEANNAVYGPGGPFARLFPSVADRLAFAKSDESKQIDALIDSLPDPPA